MKGSRPAQASGQPKVLWLYAVARGAPREPGLGARGEPLRVLRSRQLAWIFGERPPLEPTAPALRAQDRVVRRLWGASQALLPLRFGEAVGSLAQLRTLAAGTRGALAEALEVVRGGAQLTVRVFGERAPAPAPARRKRQLSGTEYLTARFRAHQQARRAPELEPLRPWLDPLVRAERVVRHDRPPLLATAYLLVDRAAARRHRSALEARATEAGLRLSVSGPFPPYAFTPEGG